MNRPKPNGFSTIQSNLRRGDRNECKQKKTKKDKKKETKTNKQTNTYGHQIWLWNGHINSHLMHNTDRQTERQGWPSKTNINRKSVILLRTLYGMNRHELQWNFLSCAQNIKPNTLPSWFHDDANNRTKRKKCWCTSTI